MLIKEYRVILPMTVAEYQVAQLFSVAEASKQETGGGEGIEILKNEPYEKDGEKGQYTHKIYHLESRVPSYVRVFMPKGSMDLEEKAWNAYPKCKTVVTNPFLDKDFQISIESLHIADDGKQDNVHGLSASELKQREVITIDIANDAVSSSDYKPEFDPKIVSSEKAGRGPLGPHWIKEVSMQKKMAESGCQDSKPPMPVMCAYKLVKCNFKWWGLQTKIEKMIHNQEQRVFTTFHRQVYCWMDKWYGMTMQDIRRLEDKTKDDLEKMIMEGEIRGTKGSD